MLLVRVFLAALLASLCGASAPAAEPQGLIVSGAIDGGGPDHKIVYDMNALQGLPSRIVKTSTPWTTGEREFVGVPLDALLKAAGAHGETLHAVALNDYAVDIPASDAVADGPIVAYKVDGKSMSVRDRGPLWIIYPFDAKAEYRNEGVYSRAIWQLTGIEVR